MDTQLTSRPFRVPADGGEAYWWFGSRADIKATADQTAGQLTLVEITAQPEETPLHVHHAEDEGFWILEGRFRFEIDGDVFEAGPGEFVWGPRDVAHRCDCLEAGRLLYLFTPGGFERFIRETSEPADGPGVPPEGRGMPDPAALGPALQRAGAEILE